MAKLAVIAIVALLACMSISAAEDKDIKIYVNGVEKRDCDHCNGVLVENNNRVVVYKGCITDKNGKMYPTDKLTFVLSTDSRRQYKINGVSHVNENFVYFDVTEIRV